MTSSIPMIQVGKIRAIAISGSTRAKLSPNVATLAEQGYPMHAEGWYGVFAPAAVRDEPIARLNADINRIVVSPDVKERLAPLNLTATPQRTPEEFRTKVRDDIRTWRSIVVENGIKAR